MITPRRSSAEDFVVAVDLGGSLTKLAYADSRGRLSAPDRLPTHLADGSDGLVSWLGDQITAHVKARPADVCRGFGVVVPGIIESATGTVKAAPNLGWYDVALQARLSQLTGLPGTVAHDVRSGGLAEWRIGAGHGVANLLFLALGTGIAGAMIVDGQLLDAHGYAGEIGHIRVQAAGSLPCACGQVGCLEMVASASGVARSYARLTAAHREAEGESALRSGAETGSAPPTDARGVADRARAGNLDARAALAIAADALTEALMIYLTLLGPELIVIGGGLSAAADLFVPQIDLAIRAQVAFQRVPRIVTAILGADAGVIGAGLVGWDHARAQAELTQPE